MRKLQLFIGAIMSIPAMLSANDINKELNKLEGTVQDEEGNTYRTVKTGEQVWLAENLRSTKFQDVRETTTTTIKTTTTIHLTRGIKSLERGIGFSGPKGGSQCSL